ncbi:MAG: LysE family translocator [SAR86 cluster bacterium]|uniref:LysE family translocator n=1 Tax=SAR86 cluster bacterium TaxID=2030880 RepID=A0A838XWE1_9GAMM|nr:LysE family translocator [SAR86 cluster bacterium]
MMFFSAALAHLLAVMSPGPDTAIIFHQSFTKGRRASIFTALGIGFGIFVHCFFAISGISLLIYSNDEAKLFIKIFGGLYLLYIGLSFFIFKSSSDSNEPKSLLQNPFLIGLITNLLNVKAFLFTVSLFSLINLGPNFFEALIYLLYFPIVTAGWFSFVSFALTHDSFGNVFSKYSNNIQIISSLFILGLGILLLIQTFYGLR